MRLPSALARPRRVIVVLRRITKALLICLAVLLLLAVAGVYLASRTDWVRAQLRALIAEQIAERSGREVQVGEISGDLLSGVVINNFAIAAESKLEEGVILAAERIRISYDLFAVLRGRAPVACIQRVELEQAYADLVRDEKGVINLTQIFPPAEPPVVVPPEQRFRGQIVIRDNVIDYRDEAAPTRDGQPLEMRFTDVQGEVLVSQYGPLTAHLEATAADERFSSLALDVRADTEKNIFSVDGTLGGVDATWWYDRFAQSPDFQLTGGRLAGRFTVWSGPSGEEGSDLDYCAYARISGATARIAALGDPVSFAGEVAVTPEGAQIETLTARWAQAQVQAVGSIFDWSHPCLDLAVQVSNLPSGSLLDLLPLQTRQSLDMLEQADRIDADLQIVGAPPDLTIDLTAQLAGQCRVVLADDVHLTLSGLEVQAAVPNVAAQAVAAHVSAQQISVSPLVVSAPSDNEVITHAVRISDLAGFEAELLYAGETPVLESALRIEQVTVDDLPIGGLTAGIQMVGRTVRVSGVRAQVAGGEIVGQALAQFNDDWQPTVHFDLAARDLQLADVGRLHGLDIGDLAGEVNLLLVGYIADNQPMVAGRARVNGLQVQDAVLEEAVGLVQWRGEDIRVPIVHVRSDMGQLWADGAVSLSGEFDLQLTAADLDMAAWGRQFDQPDLTGTAYVRANLAGSRAGVAGSVQLAALDAGYQDVTVDALAGKLNIEQSAVHLEELLAARGAAVLKASGRLAGLEKGSESMPVAADLKVVGIELEEISDRAGLDPPFGGVGEMTATLAGTVDEPEISARVGIPYGYCGPYPITEANLVIVGDQNKLRVTEGSFRWAEGTVRLRGEVVKWAEYLGDSSVRPDYSARLSIENADLQAIVSPERTDVQIEGRVALPVVEIRSTPTGPGGHAHLLVPRLVIGGQQISTIDTMVRVDNGKVSLQDTSMQVGSAQIQATAGYSWQDKQGTAKLTLTEGRIEELLRLAAPVSKLVAAEADQNISRDLRSYSLRTRGAVDLSFDVRGSPEAISAQVRTKITQLSFDRKDLPDVSSEFALDLVDGKLAAVSDIYAEIAQGEGLLTVEGEVDPDGELSLFADGSNFSLALWQEWLPQEISLSGMTSLTVAASGPMRSPHLKASLDVNNPTFQGVRFDQARVPIATLDQNGLDIDVLLLKLEEQEIVLQGKLPFRWQPPGLDPDGEIVLSAKIENTDLSFFPPLLDEFVRSRVQEGEVAKATTWSELKTRGRVDSEVIITGKLQDPVLQGYLRISDAKVATPGASHSLENLQVDIGFSRGEGQNVLDIRNATARWDNTVLTAAGQAWLSDSSALWHNEFDLSIDLDSPAQKLFGETVVKNLTGRVTLVTQADFCHLLTIEEITGGLGKGSVQLSGSARLATFDLPKFANNPVDIRLALDKAAVSYPPIYDGLVDGSIVLANREPGQPAAAVGELVLHDARVGPPAAPAAGGAPVYGWGPDRPSPTFDLKVAIGPRVLLKAPGLSATLEQTDYAARATGTPQSPRIVGRVEISPGKARVSAGSVRISQLGVEYRYGPELGEYQPPVKLAMSGEIWGQAEQVIPSAVIDGRQVEQLIVFVEIDGNLPAPINLHLTSRPPLSEDQLYQIIGTQPLGLMTARGEGGTDITKLLSQKFTGLLAAGFRATVFRPIEEQIRQALGLEEFTVLFGFDQPVDVHLGKYLIKDLLVSYRHSVVSEMQDEWDLSISYKLPRRLDLSYTTDEKGDTQFRISSTREF